ncbi:tRNA glutamyl-Q(34) synthetase GluQRS [Cohaesibacter intestini]|uniref:tRNA glutamyl-Q(34) synthetase GluQRS n=1 Tax=Cohaesibacter intestini TaxID=2211145 RepID=UPI000DEA5133|nr:tRNA glutamyl-Q(34) synthetase GluQRS [Cohaesibacter intestini]
MCPIFRFAPSPNGALHLGHALSALINFEAAQRRQGQFLLRIEDIDTIRCTPNQVNQMTDDLRWLGLDWPEPVVQQSSRFDVYAASIDQLKQRGLLYPSIASRKEIRQAIARSEEQTGHPHPRDPDGAPLFPRHLLKEKEHANGDCAWRLDMEKAMKLVASAPLNWQENGLRSPSYPQVSAIPAQPNAWGDVILARKDCPTSYHLSVVVDDAAQKISHVVRGQDLYHATGLHRLLQQLLALPAPLYHHHRLLTDIAGQKLSKSRGDLSLKTLRAQGATPADIRTMIEFSDDDLAAFLY